MHYIGSKYYMRKPISDIINQVSSGKTFVSLFCGSCCVESRVQCKTRIINDLQPFVMAMWKALVYDRYEFPFSVITKDQYMEYKRRYINGEYTESEMPDFAFVGTCYSLFGKWFGSYYQLCHVSRQLVRTPITPAPFGVAECGQKTSE